MTYSEKLRDPRWQKKRLEVLNRDKFTCCICDDTETELHVHHKSYLKGAEPWEYEINNFKTLCKDCHSVVEFIKKDYTIISAGRYPKSETCSMLLKNNNTGELLLHIILFRGFGEFSTVCVFDLNAIESYYKSFKDFIDNAE